MIWISTIWGPPLDSAERAWQFTVIGMAFVLGSTLSDRDYRHVVYAFGAGILLNLPIVYLQSIGWEGIATAEDPAGFFFNGTFLANSAALALVSLAALVNLPVLGVLTVALLWAIVIAGGKGALVGVGLTLAAAFWNRQRMGAVGVFLCGILIGYWLILQGSNSLEVRLPVWFNSLELIMRNPFGYGASSFWSAYPAVHDFFLPTDPGVFGPYIHPRTAHNDLITLTVEFGIPGLALFLALIIGLLRVPCESRADFSAHYGLWAFMALGIFNFPLYNPTAAAFAAVLGGYLSRNWIGVFVFPGSWRIRLFPSGPAS